MINGYIMQIAQVYTHLLKIVDKLCVQENPDLVLILEISKMKLLEMHVRKLHLRMILMYVILVQLISQTFRLLKNSNVLLNSVPNSLFVERYEQIYHTIKYIKYAKKIDDLDLALWVSMHGYYNVDRDTK